MNEASLRQHTGGRLAALCAGMGLGAAAADHVRPLSEVFGDATNRPLNLAPASPSDIFDDHTRVEFCITFRQGRRTAAISGGARPGRIGPGGQSAGGDRIRRIVIRPARRR